MQEVSEEPLLALHSVDLLQLDAPTPHIARYLPWIRDASVPFIFLVQIMIPGTPALCLILAWAAQAAPDSPTSAQPHLSQSPIDLSLAR